MATEVFRIIITQTGATRASGQIRRLGRSSARAGRSVNLLRTSLIALTAGVGLRQLAGLVDEFTNIRNRIRLTTSDTDKQAAAFVGLRQVANDTRADLGTTSELFRRLSVNTRDLGLNQTQLLQVIKTVNQSIAVSGATAKEARSGIIQLAQGFASGQLRGEEFRSVAEQLPGLMIAIADGTGLTIGQLRELAFEGKLNAKVVAQALLSQGKVMDETFKNVTPTIEQVFTILKNEATVAIGLFGEITRGTTSFTTTLQRGARAAAPALVRLFAGSLPFIAEFLRAGANVLSLLRELGLESVNMGNIFKLVFGGVTTLVQGFANAINGLRLLLANARLDAAQENLFFQPGTPELLAKVATAQAAADAAQGDFLKTSDAVNASLAELGGLITDISGGTDIAATAAQFNDFATSLDESAVRAGVLATELERTKVDLPVSEQDPVSLAGQETPAAARARTNAVKKIISLTEQLRISNLKAVEPLTAQLEKIKQQRAELVKLGVTANDINKTKEALGILDAQEARVQGQITSLGLEQKELLSDIETNIAEIARTSPEFADQMTRAKDAVLAAGGGLEKINQGLEQVGEKTIDILQREQDRVGKLGEEIGGKIAEGIAGALSGEATDFAEIFTAVATDIFKKQFTELFQDLGRQFAQLLSKNISGNIGKALGAAVGIGGLLLSGALRDTTSDVSNDLATESIVTDTRAVRGVVAGDTSIPIFQLGEELENANDRVVSVLEEILDAVRGGSGDIGDAVTDDSEAGILLSITSPSLI